MNRTYGTYWTHRFISPMSPISPIHDTHGDTHGQHSFVRTQTRFVVARTPNHTAFAVAGAGGNLWSPFAVNFLNGRIFHDQLRNYVIYALRQKINCILLRY